MISSSKEDFIKKVVFDNEKNKIKFISTSTHCEGSFKFKNDENFIKNKFLRLLYDKKFKNIKKILDAIFYKFKKHKIFDNSFIIKHVFSYLFSNLEITLRKIYSKRGNKIHSMIKYKSCYIKANNFSLLETYEIKTNNFLPLLYKGHQLHNKQEFVINENKNQIFPYQYIPIKVIGYITILFSKTERLILSYKKIKEINTKILEYKRQKTKNKEVIIDFNTLNYYFKNNNSINIIKKQIKELECFIENKNLYGDFFCLEYDKFIKTKNLDKLKINNHDKNDNFLSNFCYQNRKIIMELIKLRNYNIIYFNLYRGRILRELKINETECCCEIKCWQKCKKISCLMIHLLTNKIKKLKSMLEKLIDFESNNEYFEYIDENYLQKENTNLEKHNEILNKHNLDNLIKFFEEKQENYRIVKENYYCTLNLHKALLSRENQSLLVNCFEKFKLYFTKIIEELPNNYLDIHFPLNSFPEELMNFDTDRHNKKKRIYKFVKGEKSFEKNYVKLFLFLILLHKNKELENYPEFYCKDFDNYSPSSLEFYDKIRESIVKFELKYNKIYDMFFAIKKICSKIENDFIKKFLKDKIYFKYSYEEEIKKKIYFHKNMIKKIHIKINHSCHEMSKINKKINFLNEIRNQQIKEFKRQKNISKRNRKKQLCK